MNTSYTRNGLIALVGLGICSIIGINYYHQLKTSSNIVHLEGKQFAQSGISLEKDTKYPDNAAIGPHKDWDIEANSSIQATLDIWLHESSPKWNLVWNTSNNMVFPKTLHIHNATLTEAIMAVAYELNPTTVHMSIYTDNKALVVYNGKQDGHMEMHTIVDDQTKK